MKRYSTTSIRAYAPVEDPGGEWVKYADVLDDMRANIDRTLTCIWPGAEEEDDYVTLNIWNEKLTQLVGFHAWCLIAQQDEVAKDILWLRKIAMIRSEWWMDRAEPESEYRCPSCNARTTRSGPGPCAACESDK